MTTTALAHHGPDPELPDPTDPEAGMATAEYAIGTIAAAGFAALLLAIINGGAVMNALTSLITRALNLG